MTIRRTTIAVALVCTLAALSLVSCVEENAVDEADEFATTEQAAVVGPAFRHCILNSSLCNGDRQWTTVQQFASRTPLMGVWGEDEDEFHVVGFERSRYVWVNGDGRAVRFDGNQWQDDMLPGSAPLHGIHSAAGQYRPVVVGAEGIARSWNGVRWSPIETYTAEDLNATLQFPGIRGYIVGDSGTLLRTVGRWARVIDVPTEADLNAIWGTNGASIVVGDAGTVLNIRPRRARLVASPTSENLNGIWGTNGASIIVGDSGTVIENGGFLRARNLQLVSVPTSADLNGIWGTNGASIIVGDAGTVLFRANRFESFQLVQPFTEQNLTSVWGSSLENIVITSEEGGVFKFSAVPN